MDFLSFLTLSCFLVFFSQHSLYYFVHETSDNDFYAKFPCCFGLSLEKGVRTLNSPNIYTHKDALGKCKVKLQMNLKHIPCFLYSLWTEWRPLFCEPNFHYLIFCTYDNFYLYRLFFTMLACHTLIFIAGWTGEQRWVPSSQTHRWEDKPLWTSLHYHKLQTNKQKVQTFH